MTRGSCFISTATPPARGTSIYSPPAARQRLAGIAGNSIAHCSDGVRIGAGASASVDFNTFSSNFTDLDLTDLTSRVTSLTHNAFNVGGNAGSRVIVNLSPVNIDATTDTFS